MRVDRIPYHQTNSFSKFVLDYISGATSLKPFYNRAPKLDSFKAQILEKQKQPINRKRLVEVLQEQYQAIETTDLVENNITILAQENTFTVATGHQLCLFTGPLYFIYKIISTINLAETLRLEFPEFNFVPIFWMATEDHDFEEVNHVYLFGKKLEWKQDQKGAVGAIPTKTLESLFAELKVILGSSKEAESLYNLFSEAYLQHSDLASASRYLVNALFSKYGLVILDASDKQLKNQSIELIKADVLNQSNHDLIKSTSADLSNSQAFARPINYFYLQKGSRNRIEQSGDEFVIINSDLKFSRAEMELEIENYPERFSPNVLLRPLYKELILPNLAMIGGGAEVNYWMQLKTTFENNKIVYPILLLRNSAMIVDEKSFKKIDNLGFSVADFFSSEEELKKSFVLRNSDDEIDVSEEKKQLELLYDSLVKKATDKGVQSSILAEKQRQLKSIDKIEQKLLKFAKQQHEVALRQITQQKQKLFPLGKLQERYDNLIPFYLMYGASFIEILKQNLNPLEQSFFVFIQD